MSVSRYADSVVARRTAKQLALQLGFSSAAQEQIVLVVSELASNLIKYAGRGTVNLQTLAESDRAGILISSHDRGPGFDAGKALADGYSSSGTLGIGLGSVKRMVDVMEIHSRQGGHSGTDIICKKWLPAPFVAPKYLVCPLDIGAVSRPKQGFDVNGDAYLIKREHSGSCLIAVIDGVGHGARAQRAARTAEHYIDHHSDQPIPGIFRGIDLACQATSGVVMALAYFDHGNSTLTFASIGNIEAKVVGGDEKVSLLLKRGILGRQAPAPIISRHRWSPGQALVLHSDGVSSRWNWHEFAHLGEKPAQFIAEQMHRKLQKDSDDATLIFVK
ncbi:MAG: ATP-binding protein/SpoIIE family protein phosphatase [Methylovulum sp.]|nr:ATP-binding protein/SpoIIE family protein phosphatase [Methylovulum sp.]